MGCVNFWILITDNKYMHQNLHFTTISLRLDYLILIKQELIH